MESAPFGLRPHAWLECVCIDLGRGLEFRHSFGREAQEFITGNQNPFSVPRGFHHPAPDIADQRVLADSKKRRALFNRVLKAARKLILHCAHGYIVRNNIAHGND